MLDTYFLSDKFWLHLEIFGFITGLIYVYLELKQKISMWILGSISSAIFVIIFAFAKIYADMCFNFYNLIIGIYGLTLWLKNSNEDLTEEIDDSKIYYNHITKTQMTNMMILSFILYFGIYIILANFTDSPIPYGDSFTTTLSIIAVYLLAKKVIEQWVKNSLARRISTIDISSTMIKSASSSSLLLIIRSSSSLTSPNAECNVLASICPVLSAIRRAALPVGAVSSISLRLTLL